jgi:PD-(D/E)XK nuclease superfamily
MSAFDLNPAQHRTVRSLLGPSGSKGGSEGGPGAAFDRTLPGRLREHIEAQIGALTVRAPIRLSKERLNELDRCEGSYAASLAGERPVWEPSPNNAVGTLLHRALEADAASAREREPAELVAAACAELTADRRFGPFVAALSPEARGVLEGDARSGVELFRASFPPLGPARRLLAPLAEQWLVVPFAGGIVTALGRVDLIVGRFDRSRASRVLVDLKTGGAWPEHAQDMRLYALLFTVRYGAPPLRVASFFLRSGECQPEDVTEELLFRSADRLVNAVGAAARLAPPANGDDAHGEPVLRPGPWCAWCPRRQSCPAAAAAGTNRQAG